MLKSRITLAYKLRVTVYYHIDYILDRKNYYDNAGTDLQVQCSLKPLTPFPIATCLQTQILEIAKFDYAASTVSFISTRSILRVGSWMSTKICDARHHSGTINRVDRVRGSQRNWSLAARPKLS